MIADILPLSVRFTHKCCSVLDQMGSPVILTISLSGSGRLKFFVAQKDRRCTYTVAVPQSLARNWSMNKFIPFLITRLPLA